MAQVRDGREPSEVIAQRAERTLYDVLQINPRAEVAVVQAAYRALARAFHPDLNRDPAAAPRMREVNEAYAVLNDPRQRTLYDLSLNQQRRVEAPTEGGVVRTTRRRSLCWRCKTPLEGVFSPYCDDCHWLVCESCSACGCQNPKARAGRQTRRLRLQALIGWIVAAGAAIGWMYTWALTRCIV